MLEAVKLALRVSSTAFDFEIQDLIDAGESDLRLAGIYFVDNKDALIKRAIILYAKANYGLDSPNAERYGDSYYLLKQHLSLAGDYNEPLV